MSHLTEEQFESILQGQLAPADHLQECEICSNKLAEKKAIAHRLRSSFSGIQASDQLAEQIKAVIEVGRFGRERALPLIMQRHHLCVKPRQNLNQRYQPIVPSLGSIDQVAITLRSLNQLHKLNAFWVSHTRLPFATFQDQLLPC